MRVAAAVLLCRDLCDVSRFLMVGVGARPGAFQQNPAKGRLQGCLGELLPPPTLRNGRVRLRSSGGPVLGRALGTGPGLGALWGPSPAPTPEGPTRSLTPRFVLPERVQAGSAFCAVSSGWCDAVGVLAGRGGPVPGAGGRNVRVGRCSSHQGPPGLGAGVPLADAARN